MTLTVVSNHGQGYLRGDGAMRDFKGATVFYVPKLQLMCWHSLLWMEAGWAGKEKLIVTIRKEDSLNNSINSYDGNRFKQPRKRPNDNRRIAKSFLLQH